MVFDPTACKRKICQMNSPVLFGEGKVLIGKDRIEELDGAMGVTDGPQYPDTSQLP